MTPARRVKLSRSAFTLVELLACQPKPRRRQARAAFTLVELLVAIVVAVLLIAVVFSTYRTASLVAGGQKKRADETQSAAAALEQLELDLMRAFIPAGDNDCRIALTQNLERAHISFCMMQPSETDADLRWAQVQRVGYGVTDGRLLKTARPLSGPGSLDGPRTNQLAEGVEKFSIALFDGVEWQTRWPGVSTNEKPKAARLEIGTTDHKSWSTEIWIPAGTVFTSSIQRAATTPET